MLAESQLTGRDAGPTLLGRVFGGRYRVERLLGQGGMGWVFSAAHVVMEQTVAIKVMYRELARDMASVKRFFQEARACSRLKHHNTIKVQDFGVSEDGFPFLVMEYLEGRSLADVIAEDGPFAPARAVHVAAQIGKSLHEAHEAGIIHRDLKPANVFLTEMPGEADYVKVLDFGIAKFVEGAEDEEPLTRSGFIIGTPQYMSPEQIRRQPLDRRSDLYSLGVLLFEMLTGRLPFEARTTAETLSMQLHDPPPPLAHLAPGTPSTLGRLVDELLAKDRNERPARAEDVLCRLAACIGEVPPALRVTTGVRPRPATGEAPVGTLGARTSEAGARFVAAVQAARPTELATPSLLAGLADSGVHLPGTALLPAERPAAERPVVERPPAPRAIDPQVAPTAYHAIPEEPVRAPATRVVPAVVVSSPAAPAPPSGVARYRIAILVAAGVLLVLLAFLVGLLVR